jgi:hypothetical protein
VEYHPVEQLIFDLEKIPGSYKKIATDFCTCWTSVANFGPGRFSCQEQESEGNNCCSWGFCTVYVEDLGVHNINILQQPHVPNRTPTEGYLEGISCSGGLWRTLPLKRAIVRYCPRVKLFLTCHCYANRVCNTRCDLAH